MVSHMEIKSSAVDR